jgi:hypothetical protein
MKRLPAGKGLTLMENSIFDSRRMEDVWLDKGSCAGISSSRRPP